MKKADKQSVVIILNGDNNKVSLNETHSHSSAIATRLIIVILIAVAVLTVFLCCPELLADFVRWIISTVVNS